MGRRVAAAVLALAVATSIARADCCTPLPVSRASWRTSSGWGGLPTWVGATDDGWVHVVHRDANVAWIYTSSDAGLHFGFPDTTFTEGSTTDGFALAPDGTLLAGYQRDGQVWFRKSSDRAASWTPAVALGPMDAPGVSPHPDYVTIVARPSGLVALMTITSRTAAGQAHSVYVSSDMGTTWSPALTEVSTDNWHARIAADDTTVVFAYEQAGEIRVRTTADAGQSWGPPARANVLPLDALPVHALAVTGPGAFQLIYGGDGTAADIDMRSAVSLDAGATWPPAQDSSIGTTWAAPGRELFVQATPSGGLVAGGWLDPLAASGVASNFSSDRGLPGTWLAAPAMFSTAGRAQHDFETATLADDTVIVVHDDYRHDGTAACTGGTCESIYMSRACPATGAWEEFRLDEDEWPNPAHSEEPAIATTSAGRLHVAWLNGSDSGVGVVQMRSMAVQQATDMPVMLTVTPASDCLSATHVLSLDTALLTACPGAAVQWYLGASPVAGATATTLTLDPADVDGVNAWHAVVTCGSCAFRTLDIVPPPFDPAAPLVVTRTDVPPDGCHPARVILDAVPIPVAECPLAAYQWFADGSPVPGARSPRLVVSADDFAAGAHVFRCEARCTPARACGGTTWPDEIVDVPPSSVVLPANVGAGLRVQRHGDPNAATVTAELDWSRDEGLPRTDEHYHVLRGTSPTLLATLPGLEPLTALTVTDATPAATLRPLVHFYVVLAANACEDISVE